jgi:hypothetical protein
MDGGEQLGRSLCFLDSGTTEEEEEECKWWCRESVREVYKYAWSTDDSIHAEKKLKSFQIRNLNSCANIDDTS